MYTRKKLPKTQYELSKGTKNLDINRANEIRRDDDTLKELSIGLHDLDYTIKYYFDNVIKPQVVEAGQIIPVPVFYGSPEKWKTMQADGYFRDRDGKIQCPLIAYKRTGIAKNRALTNKVDANYPNLYYTTEVKYSQENRYDQFSKLTNAKPIKTYINTVVPEYIDVSYQILVWTDYVESMNKIVESIIYSEGAYWGDEARFKFRTKVDNWQNTTDLLTDNDRVVRTTFDLTLYGYIVPDALIKKLSTKVSEKTFSERLLRMDMEVDNVTEQLTTGKKETPKTVIPSATNNTTVVNITQVQTSVSSIVTDYLNANVEKTATSVTIPDTAIFTANFLSAPSPLPTTSIDNFLFFVNGQLVERTAVVSFTNTSNNVCTLVVDVGELGYTLSSSDEIIAIGKFS